MDMELRRATDALDLTEPQKAFLDQVCAKVVASVADAVTQHEGSVLHVSKDEVAEVVKMMLAAGDFLLPNGVKPEELLKQHGHLESGQARLEKRHDKLDRNVGRLLDVVVGPVKKDFVGDLVPDGERDESQGLMHKTESAVRAAEKLDAHLSNGGVPVKLPTSIKAAILTAAGTIIASGIGAAALVIAAQ